MQYTVLLTEFHDHTTRNKKIKEKEFFFYQRGCSGQLAYISTNFMGPEINDNVNFQ